MNRGMGAFRGYGYAVVMTALAMAVPARASGAVENALENVERRTAEILKIKRDRVGEWDAEKGRIAVVGIAALENRKPEEILRKRHELVEIAIMDAKLKLAAKLQFVLDAGEKRHVWNDSVKNEAGITTSSKIRFLAKHRISGATVLLQSESHINGEYLLAVSLVWSRGLQKSAERLMDGRGGWKAETPGRYSLEEWLEKNIDISQVVGPRQYVDNKGTRHFIGIASMIYDRTADKVKRTRQEGVLQLLAASSVAYALRADVETSTACEMILKQISSGELDGREIAVVSSELTQCIRQRFSGVNFRMRPLFKGDCLYREHPLFPGSKMAIYACEYAGESGTCGTGPAYGDLPCLSQVKVEMNR